MQRSELAIGSKGIRRNVPDQPGNWLLVRTLSAWKYGASVQWSFGHPEEFCMKTKLFLRLILVGLGVGSTGLLRAADAKPAAADPETIYCIYHVKPGHEKAFAEVRANTWAIYRRLDLVQPKPHVVVGGREGPTKPYVVEIFTWRDSAIPDNAPPEVLEAWKKLGAECETRDGRPGIDFADGGVKLIDAD